MIDPGALKSWTARLAGPFWGVLLLDLVARGQALFAPMASIDSYDVARRSFSGEIAYCLGDGRFVRAALWWAQQQLGFLPLESMSASLCLAIPLFIVSGFLFAAAILDDLRASEAFVCAALFTLHPFASEYFYYGEVAFATVLAVFFASVAVWSAFRAPPSPISRGLAVGAVVLALGDYQITIGHIAAGGLLVRLRDSPRGDRAPSAELLAFARSAGVLALGVILYLLCLVATRFLFPAAAASRAFPGHVPDFAAKLDAIGGAIGFALWPPNGIVAPAVSMVTLVALALCLAALVHSALAARGLLQALAVALAVGAAILCAACAAADRRRRLARAKAVVADRALRRRPRRDRLSPPRRAGPARASRGGRDCPAGLSRRRRLDPVRPAAGQSVGRSGSQPDDRAARSRSGVRQGDFTGDRRTQADAALRAQHDGGRHEQFGLRLALVEARPRRTGDGLPLSGAHRRGMAGCDRLLRPRPAWPTPGSAAVKDELAIVCLAAPVGGRRDQGDAGPRPDAIPAGAPARHPGFVQARDAL